MSNQYSKEEVWAAAKLIWENTPQITDRELLDQLQTTYGESAPKSSGSVSKRRKKEAWTKQNLVKSPKNSLKTEGKDAGSKQSRKQEAQNNTLTSSKTNKAQNTNLEKEAEAAGSKISEITDNVVIDAQGRAAIIGKTRRRFTNLGKLFDQAVGAAMSIQGHVEAASFDEDGKPSDEVQKALLLSESLSETAGNLAKTLKIIAEVEMPLCGITPDDFKQSDQERRLDALAALGDIDAKERAARERMKPELMERLARIKSLESSEDFGLDSDDDDDIDEIDYVSVD